MALYKGKPVMLGAYETYKLDELDNPYSWRSNASYFETFDIETEEWSDLNRNPFFNESTKWYWEGTSVTKTIHSWFLVVELDFIKTRILKKIESLSCNLLFVVAQIEKMESSIPITNFRTSRYVQLQFSTEGISFLVRVV